LLVPREIRGWEFYTHTWKSRYGKAKRTSPYLPAILQGERGTAMTLSKIFTEFWKWPNQRELRL